MGSSESRYISEGWRGSSVWRAEAGHEDSCTLEVVLTVQGLVGGGERRPHYGGLVRQVRRGTSEEGYAGPGSWGHRLMGQRAVVGGVEASPQLFYGELAQGGLGGGPKSHLCMVRPPSPVLWQSSPGPGCPW